MRFPFSDIYRAVTDNKSTYLQAEIDGTIYRRRFQMKERLILLGGGYIAQQVCRYAADLGFAVTVVDDRQVFANHEKFPDASEILCESFDTAIEKLEVCETDYVAVLTRGHRHDGVCLRDLLPGTMPKYLGMIGSGRRVKGLFDLLEEDGFPKSALEQIHAPIGLPIHALTIKEVAISIIAELIMCRRTAAADQKGSTALVSEDVDLHLLEFLACDPTPKAFLMVYETIGSTPVKSGAMMAVNKDYRSAGSIGGGCSEGNAMKKAYHMIGTGRSETIEIDMSNDVTDEEGMVCGGRMKVLLTDLSSEEQ